MHAFHLVIYLTGDRSMAHFKANFRKNIKKCATDCYFLSFFVIFATDLYYLFHLRYVYVTMLDNNPAPKEVFSYFPRVITYVR